MGMEKKLMGLGKKILLAGGAIIALPLALAVASGSMGVNIPIIHEIVRGAGYVAVAGSALAGLTGLWGIAKELPKLAK